MQQSSMPLLLLAALGAGFLGCKRRDDVTHKDVLHQEVKQETASVGIESPEPPITPHFPGWVLMDEKAFSFYAPPDMKSLPVQGVDSFVGEYHGDSITLHFDYGRFSNPLENRDGTGVSEYSSQVELIGGKNAKVVSLHSYGEKLVGVYFPSAGGEGIRLTVTATGKTPSDYETAKTIFRTIQFPHR